MAPQIAVPPVVIEITVIGEIAFGEELQQLCRLRCSLGFIALVGIGGRQVFACRLDLRQAVERRLYQRDRALIIARGIKTIPASS